MKIVVIGGSGLIGTHVVAQLLAIEIAGPAAASMGLLVSRLLHRKGDRRRVIAAPDATYFGAPITDATLVPASGALKGRIAFEQWLQTRA
jgi:uncharacterized protein YbjT (DUF2867 family)